MRSWVCDGVYCFEDTCIYVHVYCYLYRESASCTHVSGLLHALVAMCPSQAGQVDDSSDTEDPLPVTSFACKWKQPRKRKDCTMKMSEVTFQKHVYGRQVKHTLQSIDEFDPRPSVT